MVGEKVATEMMEETQQLFKVVDAYPIDLEITPNTGNEDLREIGAIGSLLVELIKETCGLNGRITVDATPAGVRIRIEPTSSNLSSLAAIGGA
jgi:hypothetical protein